MAFVFVFKLKLESKFYEKCLTDFKAYFEMKDKKKV